MAKTVTIVIILVLCVTLVGLYFGNVLCGMAPWAGKSCPSSVVAAPVSSCVADGSQSVGSPAGSDCCSGNGASSTGTCLPVSAPAPVAPGPAAPVAGPAPASPQSSIGAQIETLAPASPHSNVVATMETRGVTDTRPRGMVRFTK